MEMIWNEIAPDISFNHNYFLKSYAVSHVILILSFKGT